MHSTDTTISEASTTRFVVDAAALRDALLVQITLAGSQVRAAERLSISPQYLNDILFGRRDIGALAERLGYAPLTVFVPVGEPAISSDLAARVIERLRRDGVEIGGAS